MLIEVNQAVSNGRDELKRVKNETDELLAKASERHSELTIEEVKAFREFKERFMALCQRAYDNDVRITQ